MKKYLPIVLILILASTLRLFALDKFPAGLNADEAAIGYNAWSLIQTGKDEHGTSWPLVFRSFDDYKPPVYFYLVLPFVKVLGLNIWAVRLPSALLGIISVYLVFLLAMRLLPNNKYFPYFSALVLAVSPWHLQFSRGGWEVNTSLFFILLGLWAFFKTLEALPAGRQTKYLFIFVLSLVVSLYTYHSARLISPLLALSLVLIYWQELLALFKGKNIKITLVVIATGLILVLPLAGQLLSKEGQSRFSGVSVFSDTGPLWQALEMRRAHTQETLFIKALHNQYLSYGFRFVKNYLSHYSFRFLFFTGDEIARSKVPGMGQDYRLLIPLYLLGLVSLFRLNSKGKIFIIIWFALAPFASALTFQSPHALRAQNMVVPLSFISALGLSVLFECLGKIKNKLLSILFVITISLLAIYSVARYLHMYYVHYPKELPYAWQYGFDRIADYVRENYDNYDRIVISDRYDQPYILMAFFLKYPPVKLQEELVMTPRDKFGFSTVRAFDKFEFRQIRYDEVDKKLPNTLIISADESVNDKAVIYTVNDPAGRPMYKFLSTK